MSPEQYDTMVFTIFVLCAAGMTLGGIAMIYCIWPDLKRRDKKDDPTKG